MERRNMFLLENQKFFDVGVLKELGFNEKFSICNVANQCYGIFCYLKTKNEHFGVLVTSRQAKNFLENDEYFDWFFMNMTDNDWESRTILLDEVTFKKMIDLKQKNDINLPKGIDLQMEEELMARNKSR